MPFHWRIILATVLGAGVVASNVGLLAAAGYLIAAAAAWHLMALLLVPIYLVRMLSVTRGLARYAERLVAHNVTFQILSTLRIWLYDRLLPLSLAVSPHRHSGDTLSRLTADIDELQNAYLRLVSPFAVAALVTVLLGVVLHVFSDTLAMVILLYLLVAGLALPVLVYVLTREAGRGHVTAKADLNMELVDSMQGVQDILSFGGAEGRLDRVRAVDQIVVRIEQRMALISGGREAMIDLLGNLAVLTALALTIPLVTTRVAPSLYLAVPALVVLAGFEAIRPLAVAAQGLGRTAAAGARVLAVDDVAPPLTERARIISQQPAGTLRFDHVTFHYPGGEPVLRDVSLTIAASTRVALVGPSGAGKSSLAHLVVRAWDPVTGAISLGGQDIRDYHVGDLRGAIALVEQDIHIFNDTLRHNLLLARPEATDQEVTDVLRVAQMTDFVDSLSDGLDTSLGEHGLRLSGGERQRLALARALLKNSPLLILDEATANLDPMTEHAVLKALERVMLGRTLVMITHRLAVMERMDEIMVLDRGRIVERGTHDELRAGHGLYRRMLDVQDSVLLN